MLDYVPKQTHQVHDRSIAPAVWDQRRGVPCATCGGGTRAKITIDQDRRPGDGSVVVSITLHCHRKTETRTVVIGAELFEDFFDGKAWVGGREREATERQVLALFEDVYAPAFVPGVWVARHGTLGQAGRLIRSDRPGPRPPVPYGHITALTDWNTATPKAVAV